MTERERLHQLVERLDEALVSRAVDVLEALDRGASPLEAALASAPIDDEPDEDDLDGGLSEARAQESLSHEDVKKQLLG